MYATALLPAMRLSPFACWTRFGCGPAFLWQHAPAGHVAGCPLWPLGPRCGGGPFGLGDQVIRERRERPAHEGAVPVDPELVPRGRAAEDVRREVGTEGTRRV